VLVVGRKESGHASYGEHRTGCRRAARGSIGTARACFRAGSRRTRREQFRVRPREPAPRHEIRSYDCIHGVARPAGDAGTIRRLSAAQPIHVRLEPRNVPLRLVHEPVRRALLASLVPARFPLVPVVHRLGRQARLRLRILLAGSRPGSLGPVARLIRHVRPRQRGQRVLLRSRGLRLWRLPGLRRLRLWRLPGLRRLRRLRRIR